MEGTRRRGKPTTTWMSTIKKRTGIKLHQAIELVQDREEWRKFSDTFGAQIRPTRLKNK